MKNCLNEQTVYHFQMLPYLQEVTTEGSSTYFFLDALHNATPKEFVPPPSLRLGIFWLLGKCANHYGEACLHPKPKIFPSYTLRNSKCGHI